MNFIWLEDFLALAASGNFSRAAESRHMTQPAFSRRIRALEEWLGAALFDRATQPATLTEAGRWFRDAAQETLARVARLPEAAQEIASGAAHTLRFAATHALSLTFLPAWLRGLESRTPLGPVQLVSDMLQQCETLMQQGRAHFLLCHAHAHVPGRLDGAGFRSIVVGADAILPVCAPDVEAGGSRDAAGRRVAVLDYSAESGLGRLTRALRRSAADGPEFETVFTAHLATVLRTMALQGRGVAWLPRSLVEEDLRAGRLIEAAGLSAALQVDVRLYRRDVAQPEAAERFWNAVTAGA
jgi:DNA-binding transcriptional LysR family regulator